MQGMHQAHCGQMNRIPQRGYHATIAGQPVGKGRPRMTRKGHVYTPSKTAEWEALAVAVFRMVKWEPIREGPVRVEIDAHAKRPQRLMRKKDPRGRMWRCAKPDGDNVLKAVLDAMVKAGCIGDDKQVADMRMRSWYCDKEDTPNVSVRWEAI